MIGSSLENVLVPGNPAPDFTLPDLEGGLHRLENYRGRIVVVNFWCAECPWSACTDESLRGMLGEWGNAVTLLTVASNANEPDDLLRRVAMERRLSLLLHDADHRVADLYGAQTTPHLFVIDAQGILRYQGAFVHNAVEALLAGRLPEPSQTSPYGCAIVRYAS